LLAVVVIAGCEKPERRQLDLDLVRVTGDAKLRTDQVGDAAYNEVATFVLVDAQNTGKDGAYITLAGELTDGTNVVSEFKAQSLWIPAGDTRTFAMVDRERKPRPTAKAARIKVRSATIPEHAPPAMVDQIREIEDDGKLVVQGTLHNTAPRPGNIVVIASFHGADGNPMTRPFTILRVPPATDQPVQFVSPPGAKHGTIFVGEMSY
jgi:hypothetical protein